MQKANRQRYAFATRMRRAPARIQQPADIKPLFA
jgi:hypothetical protein